MTLPFTPRPSQQNILRYDGGRLGIAAVPGAGKTHILSALAAQIIHEGRLRDDQEVLIVTLVNSAVDNFEARIEKFFDKPLQALYKYRVRTLHGLAHDIVREKPASVGLDERFSIVDDREADAIRHDAVNACLASDPQLLEQYFRPDLDDYEISKVKRNEKGGLPKLANDIANAFIRSAKNKQLTPEDIRLRLDGQPAPLPLAEYGWNVYFHYQRALNYRGAVDFDDLIRLSRKILEADDEYLERIRYRYPYILEDEAQDSNQTQEFILNAISGENGNWVRVGDPNQAIYETFTTADPKLLRDFVNLNRHEDMPESGRCQQSIIDIANHLIDWTMNSHPIPEVRDALWTPHIEPTPDGDMQPNPPNTPETIKFISRKYTSEEELTSVVNSIVKWLPDHPESTVAVLTTMNNKGVDVVKALQAKGIECIELLNTTSTTRAAAGSLSYLLGYLADPQSARKLSKAYEVFRRDWRDGMSLRAQIAKQSPEDEERIGELENSNGEEIASSQRTLLATTSVLLRKMADVENLVAPQNADDWRSAVGGDEAGQVIQELSAFRVVIQRWLSAVTLPIDQLVLTLAQDVFTEASDLALAHKLALVLRSAADDHADWRLPELTAELAVIAKNERRFIGFSSDDSGFDPERHRGRVVVTTMHKAKGLEWDRVYLMSVNNYDFPSNMPNDRFISEKWFVRSGLDLSAEALAQLSALESRSEYDWYEEGAATLRSRLDYVKERLRLFYVGITRAKRELIVTWNSGRQGDATPSLPLSELMGWWEGKESGNNTISTEV
ncbi:MAG: ATP-dependent helicase [Anaerolineales bacterium]|nr:ATP-dependent helicase [Anaerolineales bacterium]